MRIEAIKIGKYDPTIEGTRSRYRGYCLSTEEKHDSPLTFEAYKDFVDRLPSSITILHSTLLRGKQTAEILPKNQGVQVIPCDLLREIPFSLANMVTEEEFEDKNGGSRLVRVRFVDQFVEDRLLQPRTQIEDNVCCLLAEIDKFSKDVIIISHSFFLKILQAYVSGSDVFSNPGELANFIDADKKTFPFGGGFVFIR